MKSKIFIVIGLLLLAGLFYYSSNPEIQNAQKKVQTVKPQGPTHSDLVHKKDYLFYFNLSQDTAYSKRLYRAEKHIQYMEQAREVLNRDDDIAFRDSSFINNGVICSRFIFGIEADPNHKYAFYMDTNYERTHVFEIGSDIEFVKKNSLEESYSKSNSTNNYISNEVYNTEKWRKDAFDTGMEYLRRKIPKMENDCYVVSQGYYQPVLVSYKGNGIFKIMAKTNFDCNQNYINKRLFLITMIHYPAVGWEATINDIKFLD